jgi:predicted secreted protein
MKKLFVLVLLVSWVFGYELNFDRQFTKEVTKDKMRVNIYISTDNQTKHGLLNEMKAVLKFIKDDKTVKQTNYSQTTFPKYEYGIFLKNRQFSGYEGRVSFSVSSKDEKKIQNYIEKIINFNKTKLKISLSRLGWVVSQKQQKAVKDQLILDTVIWAKRQLKVLKNKTNSNCKIAKISTRAFSNEFQEGFKERNRYSSRSYSKNKMAKNDSIVMPSKQLVNINLNMFYIFECK